MFNRFSAFFLVLFLFFCAQVFGVGPNLGYQSWIIYHTPEYLDISGDYIYVGTNAFVVVDDSNKTDKSEVGHLRPLDGDGWPRSLAVHGNYAYTHWENHGLRIIDIKDKSNPEIVSSDFYSTYSFSNITVDYPYLYAHVSKREGAFGTWEFYLFVVDISNPKAPTLSGSFNMRTQLPQDIWTDHWPKHFIVDGDYVYYIFGPKGDQAATARLYVIDVSSPASPSYETVLELGDVDGTGAWHNPHVALDQRGDYVYVTGPFKEDTPAWDLKIVNVSDPEHPSLAAEWYGGIDSADIDIEGSFAYVTDYDNRVYVVDISSPTTPANRGNKRVPFAYQKDYSVKVRGDYAYMHMWDAHSVYTLDVSNPDNPTVIDEYKFGHDLTDVSANGSYTYASIWDWEMFFVVDMNVPKQPEIVRRCEVSGMGWGIHSSGNYAYEAMGYAGLKIFNISDPESAVQIGVCAGNVNDEDAQVWVDDSEHLAYIAVGEPHLTGYGLDASTEQSANPGLRIVDVANPASPYQRGRYYSSTQIRGVHKVGNYAYLAAREGGLVIVNVTNPDSLTFAGQWDPGSQYARGVFVKGNYAYVAYDESLRVLNISNPASISQVANIDVDAGCNDVVVEGDYAYVVTQNSLRKFDVSDPTDPVEVAYFEDIFNRGPAHVDVEGDYVYVACHNGGVYTFVSGLHVSQVEINNSQQQRSDVFKVAVEFSNDVNNIDANDFELVGTTNGTTLDANQINYSYDSLSRRLDMEFDIDNDANFGDSLLDDTYELRLDCNEISEAGGQKLIDNDDNPADEIYTARFHRLFGDADGSGDVDLYDYVWLGKYWLSSPGPTGLDKNCNDVIDFYDLDAFTDNWLKFYP